MKVKDLKSLLASLGGDYDPRTMLEKLDVVEAVLKLESEPTSDKPCPPASGSADEKRER